MLTKLNQTVEFLAAQISQKPLTGIVLGTGLSKLAKHIDIDHGFEYEDIPNFPVSTVEGHPGRLLFGTLAGKPIVAMQGRFHYYEGYAMSEITFPIRVMKLLGIETLLVSNAAGGLNPDFSTGDLMVINDHINFFPENPLRGTNFDDLGPRFPDMGNVYNRPLIKKAHDIAKRSGFKLQEGVYIGSSGPSLETPAEYRFFRLAGADATGMSTVPETVVAHHMGLKCFGMSVITNLTKPEKGQDKTSHEAVQDVAATVEPRITTIFKGLIASLAPI